jgi:protein-tyrosine phosphatase
VTGAPFPVLVVCTGNICRSPIAEQALRAEVPGGRVVFSSAGTLANDGMPMTAEAAAMSRTLGGEPDEHRSRLLTRDLVIGSGLVLTAAREHRARVVELYPRAAAYTFTLRQFARLVEVTELVPVTEGADLVAQVAARRGYVPPAAPEDDDVFDPYRRPLDVYQRSTALIGQAVGTIGPALALIR